MSITIPPVYRFKIGRSVRIGIELESGSIQLPMNVTVWGKHVEKTTSPVPPKTVPPDFEMEIVHVPASGDDPHRWYCSLTDEATAALEAGVYAVDAEFEDANGYQPPVSDVRFVFEESVTRTDV